MDDDHLRVMEKEGCAEAPDAEVFKSSIRKSSRLQNKKSSPSGSKYVSKSHHSKCKYTAKSSKTSPNKETSIPESNIQEETNQQFSHRNEINGVLSSNAESIKSSSTEVPFFRYHVQANDGIRLVVNLNLKGSDWLKSMEKAVCVYQNHSMPVSGSFLKEVERLKDRNNLKVSSTDKTPAVDASMISSVVEKEAITVSGPKWCSSKVNQNSAPVLVSSENFEEVQLSDISSSQKGSLCSRMGKICSKNLVNSTTEVNQEAVGNHRISTTKNEGRVSSVEAIKIFRREENASVITASQDGPKRKKRCNTNNHIHCESHDRILRSTPTFGGKTLERNGVNVWRSSRLHPKLLDLPEDINSIQAA